MEQARVPGTSKWRALVDDPDSEEDEGEAEEVPGVLIVRIRENLDFGEPTSVTAVLNQADRISQPILLSSKVWTK